MEDINAPMINEPKLTGFSEEDLAGAKEMLGISSLEESNKALSEANAQQAQMLEAMKNEAIYKDALSKVVSENPELTADMLNAELAKLESTSPELAKSFKTSYDGLKIFAKGIKDTIAPPTKPDDVTDDSTTSGQSGDDSTELEELVKNGKANKFQLGEFLGKYKNK